MFCDSRERMTSEHVFPQWISRLIEGKAPMMEHNREVVRARHAPQADTYLQPVFQQKVRAVCADCNNGWMSDLERAAKPLLMPGFDGRGRAFHAEGQRTLAAWGFKTALMLGEVFRGEATGVPRAHQVHLREHGEPPAAVGVWLSAFGGPEPASFRAAGMAISRPGERVTDEDEPNVYVFTFHIGPFVFQSFGVVDADAIRINPAETVVGDLRVHQLWPFRRSLTWSPRAALTSPELIALSEAIYNELQRHVT